MLSKMGEILRGRAKFCAHEALFGLVILGLSSCAMPTPPPATFVPDNELLAAALADEAKFEFQSGRYMDAEMLYQQILYLFPDSNHAKFNLAIVLGKLERPAEGETILRELIEAHPDIDQYKLALAELLFEAGDLTKAQVEFNKYLDWAIGKKDNSGAADALHSLAVIAFLEGDEKTALCYSYDSLQYDKERESLTRHVRMLLALNQIPEADSILSEYFKKLDENKDDLTVKISDKDGYLLHLYSLLRIEQGRYDEAYEYSKRASVYVGGNKDLTYEVHLVQAVLYRTSEAAKTDMDPKEDEEDSEEKKESILEKNKSVLDDDRIYGRSALYWPVNFIELVQQAADEQKQAEKSEGWSLF